MDSQIFKLLLEENLIKSSQFTKVEDHQQNAPVSVHWELRTLLYLGIVLFTTGIGILVYKNIDSISHSVIVIFLGFFCAACFFYCIKTSKGYSNYKIQSPNILFDYILLLGCLLLLTLVGYLQFQYQIFENRWGMATFIPMIFLFIAAYYFDHLGVLSLAITNLGAWADITVTPLKLLQANDFSSPALIYTATALGVFLIIMSIFSSEKNIKSHFAFTYKNFGIHVLLVALLAGMFRFESFYLLWFLIFAAVDFFLLKRAVKENSFYFLICCVLYGYVGLSYVIIRILLAFDESYFFAFYLGFAYFIGSGIFLMIKLIQYNKIMRKNGSL